MCGATAPRRHREDWAGDRIVGNDGARSRGVVPRGSVDGLLRAERTGTAFAEGRSAAELLCAFGAPGRSPAEGFAERDRVQRRAHRRQRLPADAERGARAVKSGLDAWRRGTHAVAPSHGWAKTAHLPSLLLSQSSLHLTLFLH